MVDREHWVIDSQLSESLTEKSGVISNTRSFFWSDEFQTLNVRTVASGRLLGEVKQWDGNIVSSYYIDKGGVLNAVFASEINTTENGETKKDLVTTRCVYHKG